MSTSGSSDTERIPVLNDEQMDLVNRFAGILSGRLGRSVRPPPFDLAAPASPLQEMAFSMIPGLGTSDMARTRQAALSGIMEGRVPFANDQAFNSIFQTMAAPARRSFYGPKGTLDQVLHRFGSSGRSGVTLGALADASADFESNLAGQGYEQQFGTLRSLFAPSVQASAAEETRPIRYALEAGAQQRDIANQQIAGRYQKWLLRQPWSSPWLQFLPAALTKTHAVGQETDEGGGLWSWISS